MYNVGYSIDKDDNKVAYAFAEQLPHGSGIDHNWEMEVTGNYVYFTNSYHCMDEYGGYDGWQDFRIRIDATAWNLFVDAVEKYNRYMNEDTKQYMLNRANVMKDIISEQFTLQFTGNRYKAEKYFLADYLSDTISWDIHQMDMTF